MKNDAHEGKWIQYLKTEHPRFGCKITSACLMAKLNSKNDIRAKRVFHPTEIHWVTNPDGTLHTHGHLLGILSSCTHNDRIC